ncbi:MAG: 50S ribosomal protein L5 [Methanomicrobiaceae archaeon]|nr:50S ribosomal protein L5 [Methanomicrobiaceae archaeon]
MNPMQDLRIEKVVVHMGVGESGEKLVKAENIIKEITSQKPIRSIAKKTQPAFGIRKGAPIGCRVTLRGDAAEQFIGTALDIIEKRLSPFQFDQNGTFSFGIEEHTDFPGQSYDPMIGIYGMDVNVVLSRRGLRVARRSIQQQKIPLKQKVDRNAAIAFMHEKYGMVIE